MCHCGRSKPCWSPKRRSAPIESGRYVLVVNAENVVEQRKVTIGETFDGLRRILTGLTAKDKVIVVGLLQAAPGQKVARTCGR